MPTTDISIHPARIVRILFVVALVLLLASIAGQLAAHLHGHVVFRALDRLLFVNAEKNIPTAFSAGLLLLASLVLTVIAVLKRRQHDRFAWHWLVLAAGFLFMGIDEAWSYHEKLVDPVRAMLGDRELGVLYFAWVLPGAALVAVLGVFFLGFLRHLPAATRRGFILGAALYLGGAIGMELAGGYYGERHGMDNLTFGMLSTVEEALEMAGAIVFIGALLRYFADRFGHVRFVAGARQSAAVAADATGVDDGAALAARVGDVSPG
jgi:uncharacterized membrane protein YhaH (DUF805 family)